MNVLGLLVFLALGGAFGAAHFAAIALDARLLVARGSALRVTAIRLGRIFLSGGLLVLAARCGAPLLLAAAAGLLVARQWAIQRFGAIA